MLGNLDRADTLHYKLIADLAIKARLPLISGSPETTEAGGLFSYGDVGPGLEKVALLVDKILKGAKPVDVPIEQSAKFLLAINLKTANALRITIPQAVLLSADQIIQ